MKSCSNDVDDECQDLGIGSLSPECDYNAKSKVLTLLLKPNYSIKGSTTNFSWSSGTTMITPMHNITVLDRFIRRNLTDVAQFTNTSPSRENVGVIGFSSSTQQGAITTQLVPPNGLFVFRDAFLCCSQNINVTPSVLPVTGDPLLIAFLDQSFLQGSVYYCSRAPPELIGHPPDESTHPYLIFMQSGEQILEKRLLPFETFIVNVGCLVAFDDQVSICLQHDFLNAAISSQLRITGPGMIFLSGYNSSSLRQASSSIAGGGAGRWRNNNHPSVAILRLITLLVTLAVFMLALTKMLVIDFDVRELER